MRKITLIIVLFISLTSYSQSNKLNYKDKYDNFFFRSPAKYNGQEQPFTVNKIVFSTSYDGSKSKNSYQIVIYGVVNSNRNRETIIHNLQSSKDLEYYKEIFNGKYKRILVYNHSKKVGSKVYYDTSINVEF